MKLTQKRNSYWTKKDIIMYKQDRGRRCVDSFVLLLFLIKCTAEALQEYSD